MFKLNNMLEFSSEIERLVREKEMTYLEAVIENLNKNEIEIEKFKYKNLISPTILKKIENEAYSKNMMGKKKRKKRKNKLPFKEK